MFELTDSMLKKKFPANFKWGVATAAFQIEGGGQADGKGPSIWDRFCEQTGAIADGSNGLIACDHYTKWRDDIDMISELGVNTYRLLRHLSPSIIGICQMLFNKWAVGLIVRLSIDL